MNEERARKEERARRKEEAKRDRKQKLGNSKQTGNSHRAGARGLYQVLLLLRDQNILLISRKLIPIAVACVLGTYEDDVLAETGADWLHCACGHWLHENCVDEVITA